MSPSSQETSSALVWQNPPAEIALPADEIHVWRGALDLPEQQRTSFLPLLSPDEARRAERFVFDLHRHRFIVSRGMLRRLLSRYLIRHPGDLHFLYGNHGKPSLAGLEPNSLFFNLSHSGDRFLLGLTRAGEIGIDLEQLRALENMEAIAQRFFAPREVAELAGVPQPQKIEAFFSCWTRKEAFIKAEGVGLARPLDQFTVSLRPGEPARLRDIAGVPGEAEKWSLQELRPWPDFVGCVAIQGQGWRFCCWDALP